MERTRPGNGARDFPSKKTESNAKRSPATPAAAIGAQQSFANPKATRRPPNPTTCKSLSSRQTAATRCAGDVRNPDLPEAKACLQMANTANVYRTTSCERASKATKHSNETGGARSVREQSAQTRRQFPGSSQPPRDFPAVTDQIRLRCCYRSHRPDRCCCRSDHPRHRCPGHWRLNSHSHSQSAEPGSALACLSTALCCWLTREPALAWMKPEEPVLGSPETEPDYQRPADGCTCRVTPRPESSRPPNQTTTREHRLCRWAQYRATTETGRHNFRRPAKCAPIDCNHAARTRPASRRETAPAAGRDERRARCESSRGRARAQRRTRTTSRRLRRARNIWSAPAKRSGDGALDLVPSQGPQPKIQSGVALRLPPHSKSAK